MGGQALVDHDELQGDIAAYAASRLEGEERARLEVHLKTCDACADLAATWKEIASAVREAGGLLFDRHPDERALREQALAGSTAGDPALARHIASCASCGLEVVAWRKRAAARSATRSASVALSSGGWPGATRRLALALAAGVILGVGLSLLLRPPSHRPIERAERGTEAPSPAPPAWTGPVQLLVLASPVRGEGSPPAFHLEPGPPFALIAAPLVLPETAVDGDRYRFEIRRDALVSRNRDKGRHSGLHHCRRRRLG